MGFGGSRSRQRWWAAMGKGRRRGWSGLLDPDCAWLFAPWRLCVVVIMVVLSPSGMVVLVVAAGVVVGTMVQLGRIDGRRVQLSVVHG